MLCPQALWREGVENLMKFRIGWLCHFGFGWLVAFIVYRPCHPVQSSSPVE
jgi:hypothetical protein